MIVETTSNISVNECYINNSLTFSVEVVSFNIRLMRRSWSEVKGVRDLSLGRGGVVRWGGLVLEDGDVVEVAKAGQTHRCT